MLLLGRLRGGEALRVLLVFGRPASGPVLKLFRLLGLFLLLLVGHGGSLSGSYDNNDPHHDNRVDHHTTPAAPVVRHRPARLGRQVETLPVGDLRSTSASAAAGPQKAS